MSSEGANMACRLINQTGLAHVVRVQSGALYGGRVRLAPPGTPDILGVMLRDGRAVAVEMKRPGARTAKERAEKQGATMAVFQDAGAVCGVARSPAEALQIVVDAALGRSAR